MNSNEKTSLSGKSAAIVGGGPAGLMAAEILAGMGAKVAVYEQRPSVGRKFLMAGRGGLNLTHSEDLAAFMARYGAAAAHLRPAIDAFTPAMLRQWCEDLGQPTFIGSSGRVFPKSMKASPLLRAWLTRLESLGVTILIGHRWTGWNGEGRLAFLGRDGIPVLANPDATLLALGGASWPRLGSDAAWTDILERQGAPVMPFRPANCGFTAAWSGIFRDRFAGTPVKPVILSFNGASVQGEIIITGNGVEGGAVYALSAALRDHIAAHGHAELTLDLRPGLSEDELKRRLSTPRARQSASNFLRKAAGLSPVTVGLLREGGANMDAAPAALAARIKSYPLRLTGIAPIDRAISSAGGIPFDALDKNFMLKEKPGLFAAGEMLDWEAPTGGYLLQACFSTAVAAARGMASWLNK
jgi:uncharacterized flavoprotein (TIGR03862 family)